jgi:hypothetical protein
MRASCAEKEMPRRWHRDSSDFISVLLLLALSITIAMICEHVSKIHHRAMIHIPFRQAGTVPMFSKRRLPCSRPNAPQ